MAPANYFSKIATGVSNLFSKFLGSNPKSSTPAPYTYDDRSLWWDRRRYFIQEEHIGPHVAGIFTPRNHLYFKLIIIAVQVLTFVTVFHTVKTLMGIVRRRDRVRAEKDGDISLPV